MTACSVIMATGLMALVDDCIKDRWQTPKVHHIPVPLTHRTVDVVPKSPKSFLQQVFGRSGSKESHHHHHHSNHSSPLRYANPIGAY